MNKCIEFLVELGFDETVVDDFSLEHIGEDVIESFGGLFEENILMLRDEFDDEFIVQMFVVYNDVFTRNDFGKKLSQIEKEFNTDAWATMIQYECNETGESSVFRLMDVREVNYFAAHLSEVCDKVRAIWDDDYSGDEL